MGGKSIDQLPDHTVQGMHEAHQAGEIAIKDKLDKTIVESAERLAEQSYWMWMYTSSSEEASLWQDLEGKYWIVDPETGEISPWID